LPYIFEIVCGCRTAANGSPEGNDSPGDVDRKRVRRSYQPKNYQGEKLIAKGERKCQGQQKKSFLLLREILSLALALSFFLSPIQ